MGNVGIMKDDKQIFVEWLKYAIKIECKMKGNELANKVGINPGTISGYITGKSKGPRNVEDRVKICGVLGADYQQVIAAGRQQDVKVDLPQRTPITNESPAITDKQTTVVDIDPVTTEHRELVRDFSSKRIALEANRKMVELDQSDPMRFAELVSIIGKFVNGVDFVELREEKQNFARSPRKSGTGGN
jgi:transcriptional regulator with XRE-family HTH domain